MKVWITGIAGFLGSHLADALIEEGHDVAGNDNLICGDIDNVPEMAEFNGINCCNFDSMKSALGRFQPELLVHCAATAHEGLSTFSPSFITKNIYEASVATFSAAIESGVKRIVFMSSMSRYGAGDYRPPPFSEDFDVNPADPYAIAKIAAEDTLKLLCRTHGVKWSILVPHNIIGTRQRSVDPFRNVAAIMINRCKQGKPPIIYGDGKQKRCFSPVRDCIPSIVKAVHGVADGEIINIGPDKGEITIGELAEKVMYFTGYKGDPMYAAGRPNEVKEAFCCSIKSRRILGYKEQQSVDDCLIEMVSYIEPQPFIYDFPIEIVNDKTPIVWRDKML